MGLGYPSAMWHRIRPVLSQHFRTIAFDNRGVGLSDVPPGPYSITTMASDAAAVLDAAGVARAHVFGISMGGMIAQEFALQYPERTRSLILGCTAARRPVGGARREQGRRHPLGARYDSRTSARSHPSLHLRCGNAARKNRRRYQPCASPGFRPRPATWRNCRRFCAWESYSRLGRSPRPPWSFMGSPMQLVPRRQRTLIAERIPGAKLVLLDHASHLFLTDQTEAAQRRQSWNFFCPTSTSSSLSCQCE